MYIVFGLRKNSLDFDQHFRLKIQNIYNNHRNVFELGIISMMIKNLMLFSI